MSVDVGDIVLWLRADDSKLDKDLAGLESKATSMIGKVGKRVAIATGAVALGAVVGVTKMLASTIGPASDLSETLSKSEVVFADMADSVIANSKRAATALGINQQAYLDYSSSIGAALKAGGMGVAETAELSEQAVKHFADLASFHNDEVGNVSGAWESAVRGSYEPIQKYMPFITNEYMKTFGIANGLIDENTKNLDTNQRAIILNAIAMDEELNPAFNDFEETSGGLANQQRIFSASMDNLKTTIGTGLLPVVTKFATMLNDVLARPETEMFINRVTAGVERLGDAMSLLLDGDVEGAITSLFGEEAAGKVMPVLNGITGWITETLVPFIQTHGPELKAVFIGIGAALAAAAVASTVMGIAGAIAALANPVGLVIGLIALLSAAWAGNWGGIREKTEAFVTWITPYLGALWEGIKAGFEAFKVAFQNVFELFSLAFQGNWYAFGEKLREIFDAAWENIKEIGSKAWDSIKNFFSNTDWGSVGSNILKGIAKGITGGLSILRDAAVAAANAALEAAKGFLGIHSPSTKAADEIGEPLAEGTGVGMMRKFAKMGSGMGSAALGLGQKLAPMPAFTGAGASAPVQVIVNVDKPLQLFDEYELERLLKPILDRWFSKKD